FGLGQERQQDVSHPWCYFLLSKDFERFGQIQHFGNRRRFFEAPASKSSCQAGHDAMELRSLSGHSLLKNSRFALWGWVIHAKVEAAPPERISDPPFLVGGEHNEGNARGLNGT